MTITFKENLKGLQRDIEVAHLVTLLSDHKRSLEIYESKTYWQSGISREDCQRVVLWLDGEIRSNPYFKKYRLYKHESFEDVHSAIINGQIIKQAAIDKAHNEYWQWIREYDSEENYRGE